MAKKKNWLDRLRKFFGADAKSKQEKKEKRKRWFIGKLKSKRAPTLLPPGSKSAREVKKEQNKHVVAVAVASAAAAEAAIAAAQAAANVVRLSQSPLMYNNCLEDVAATKIQTVFRGFLARSALKALKGMALLQALIRGELVRRQTTSTMKGLQSLMRIQSQARASRVRALLDNCMELSHPSKNSGFIVNINNTEKKWDSRALSRDDVTAILKKRREAVKKRERALEYAFIYQDQRRPPTPLHEKFSPSIENRRWSWLDQWIVDRPDIFSTPSRGSNSNRYLPEESELKYLARKSFNRSYKTNSVIDNDSFPRSPANVPNYMTPTACANAKFRSLSAPKQRVKSMDSCSENFVPCTDRILSPLPSSFASDMGSSTTAKKMKSPRMTKCDMSSKFQSFDFDCSDIQSERYDAFRVM